jgi:hypothetical protein
MPDVMVHQQGYPTIRITSFCTHVVRSYGESAGLAQGVDDIEVGTGWLDHHDVRSLGLQ